MPSAGILRACSGLGHHLNHQYLGKSIEPRSSFLGPFIPETARLTASLPQLFRFIRWAAFLPSVLSQMPHFLAIQLASYVVTTAANRANDL